MIIIRDSTLFVRSNNLIYDILKNTRFSTILHDDAIQLEESNDDQSKFGKVLERALTSGPLDSRAFRAGVILNPLRGLTAVENNLLYHERDVPSPVRPTDKIGMVNGIEIRGVL